MSGFRVSMASSMPVRHLLVMVERVCRGVMMSRSQSGFRSKTSSTLSSISRCWAVTQQMEETPGLAASSFTSGAILMASGRVPKTLIMRRFSICRQASLGGSPEGSSGLLSWVCSISGGWLPSFLWWSWG